MRSQLMLGVLAAVTLSVPVLADDATAAAQTGANSASTGNPIKGRSLFLSRCASCHWIVNKPGRFAKSGPYLAGLFDRKAGELASYTNYSDAMKAWGKSWTPARLDQYMADPDALVPGTSMRRATGFGPIAKAADRADILAYLEKIVRDPKAD